MSLRDRIGPEGTQAAEQRYAVTRATEVKRLRAENARLRAGIAAISSVSWDVVHPSWVKHMCHKLLNPPTEGETDADA